MALNVNDFPLQSGDLINNDNEVVNIVDLLGGTPISNQTVNKNDYTIKSGLVIGSDNKVYDITESIGDVKDDIEQLQDDVEALSSATLWKGVTTTPLTDKATTSPIELNGESVVPQNGWVVEYNSLEFAWNGSCWEQFGASSYEQLTNKPSINNVTLSGNKTSSDLGLLPSAGDTLENENFYLSRDNISISTQRTFEVESDNGGELSVNNGVVMTSTDGSTLNVGQDIILTPDRNSVINGDDGASIIVSDGIEMSTNDEASVSLGTDITVDSAGDIDINANDGNINLLATVSVDVSATETVTVNAMEGVSITGNSSDVDITATEGGDINIIASAVDPDDAGDITIRTPQSMSIQGNAGLSIYGREGVVIGALNSPASLDASNVDITYTNGFEVNWKDATQTPNVVNNIIDFYEDEVEFKTDVTTTNTTFTNTSFVTKQYVDDNTINESIVDVTTLPTGSNIKDVVYRLATTVGQETTYSYYMGDSTNQTTTELSSSPTEPTASEIEAYEADILSVIS